MIVALCFLSFVKAADHSKWRTCNQSPFCTRSRNVSPQQWTAEGPNSTDREFTCTVVDNAYANRFTLHVTFLSLQAPRIRLTPNRENWNRYDVSQEEAVINQIELNDLLEFNLNTDNTKFTLQTRNWSVVITCNPFRIDMYTSTGRQVVTLNARDTAIFEVNRPIDFSPPDSFYGYTDKFKHGANSVAMDATFYGNRIGLSGLAEHTLPLTLPQTIKDGDPIHLSNSDISGFEINSRMVMYGSIPFVMAHSRSGYSGLLWLNPSETWVDITYDSDSSETARFMSETGYIDIFLFFGDHPAEVSNAYTRLTGRPQLQPEFAFGFHQCKWGYTSQELWLSVSQQLDDAEVPHDVMWLDLDWTNDKKYFQWNLNAFPEPLKAFDTLAANGRHGVIIVDPHIAKQSGYRQYDEIHRLGFTLRTPDDKEFVGDCWPGSSVWCDYLNPEAREWWASQFSFDNFSNTRPNTFIWNDMNEPSVFNSIEGTVPKDHLHFGGVEEREVHNLYGLLMTKGTYRGLVQRDEKQNTRPFILSRSFFVGSQKYTTVWGGDNYGGWDHLRMSVSQVLQLGICGMVYSGSDVGGFSSQPSDALLTRWYQVGAWAYPFYRVHCSNDLPFRELYTLTGTNFQVAREAVYERYQLLPYWYTLAHHANCTGEPLVRPLWWEFGDDYPNIDDQFMIGSGLLVTPFLDADTKQLTVDLPSGNRWYNYRTGEEVNGTVTVQYDEGRVPVFVRGGQVIPYREVVRKSAVLMAGDPICFIVALDNNERAEGELYLDEAQELGFLIGDYIFKKVVCDGAQLILTSIAGGNTNYEKQHQVVVGMVTILGLKTMPMKVSIDQESVVFEIVRGMLILHNLNLRVGSNWRIHLQ